jgi:hypothetical protein
MARSLMIYDRTCTTTKGVPLGLSHAWVFGGRLYGMLGRFDAWHGAASWPEALDWLLEQAEQGPIASVQYWGHGNWGTVRIAGDVLDVSALQLGHPWNGRLTDLKGALSADALWWFRTCETLGCVPGHDFARRWTDFFGRDVAGYTHVIGSWQSGLHRLSPGAEPHWPTLEGLRTGSPKKPLRAWGSAPWRANTIHCLQSAIPEGW